MPSFLPRARRVAVALAVLAALPDAAFAVTDVRVWHALTGVPAETFGQIVSRFNAEQKNYRVDLAYKGPAKKTLEAGMAALKADDGPDLLQVDEVNSGDLLAQRNATRPMHEILPLAKSKDFEFFIPGAVTFMKDERSRLRAFPLEASVPVLLYNKSVFAKYGVPVDAPPATWRDLQKQLIAIQDVGRGMQCSYTSSDQAWIHIENIGALHGEPIATRNNGLDGPGATLTFNDLVHVRHIALLMSWVKSELFKPSGHAEEGDARFASGECGVLTTGTAALGDIRKAAKFEIGVAPLPYYDEAARQPVNTLVGGSALWAVEGRSRDTYNGIATFLAYLATPVVAAEWHQKTGSLPWTNAAYVVSERTGFYDRTPGLGQVMKGVSTSVGAASRGIRLPHYARVRDVMDAELDAIWAGNKPPKQGLDDAVRLGDIAMKAAVPAAAEPAKAKAPGKRAGAPAAKPSK